MGIIFDEKENIFHLQTKSTSYVMKVWRDKYLLHAYWGKRLESFDINNMVVSRFICFSPATDNEDYTLDFLCQEFPTGSGTDYRIPALEVKFDDGSTNTKLLYKKHEIYKGKRKLKGLPATYTENEEEADTLVITLFDELKGLEAEISYTVFNEADAVTRSVRLINKSKKDIIINKIMSVSVDYEDSEYDMITLPGAWGRERHMERRALGSGNMEISSRRGASSHQMNPFFALAQKHTTEDYGNVYGYNLVYSGNFCAGAEVDQLFKTRAYMGINGYNFSWTLEPGTDFQAPEAVLVFSDEGLGKMSRIYHKLYRTRLVRGRYRDEVRPILANNWEATYFDFNEEKILGLAKEAKNLGIELLVLDDGWFGKRNGDNCSLGDWYVNKDKLPGGIGNLAKKVNDIGIKFGLWFEPEMVSPDSDLYRNHPDWCIHTEGRCRTECRFQLTLDLTRKEVREYITDSVSKILDEANIAYVKWDMNRHMSEIGSASLEPEKQNEFSHRYILGLYEMMENIVSSHPDVLFESCSGGGGRMDPGMLYYMPQVWTSDDTDAVERLFIQYGTSLCYPISAMGSHVSAVPNHQVGRVTSLKMRGDVAMSGNFGYELDLMKFTDEEKEEVKKQILMYKDLRNFIQSGNMYRLKSPFEGNDVAWMFISEDGKDVFAAYFRILCRVNGGIFRMKFAGLEPEAYYKDVNSNMLYKGDELMNVGLVADLFGDFKSMTWRLKKAE